MKFKLLLWVLGKLLKRANKNNPAFKKQIENKNAVIQFQTQNQQTVRHYEFANNAIQSKTGKHAKPNLTLTFCDGNYAFDLLKKPKMTDFMQGIQQKKISIQGDMTLIMWFMGLTKLIMPKKTKR